MRGNTCNEGGGTPERAVSGNMLGTRELVVGLSDGIV